MRGCLASAWRDALQRSACCRRRRANPQSLAPPGAHRRTGRVWLHARTRTGPDASRLAALVVTGRDVLCRRVGPASRSRGRRSRSAGPIGRAADGHVGPPCAARLRRRRCARGLPALVGRDLRRKGSEAPCRQWQRPRSTVLRAECFSPDRAGERGRATRPRGARNGAAGSGSVMSPTPAVSGLWRPLRTPMFRQLLVADIVSDVGTFMQGVGSAWLMVSLGAGPLYIALTQTASTLPFFLFSLPAGSIGDIADRRKLILYTETWMVCVAAALAVTTLTGIITPWLLLALTFALSAGDAVETPTWRAVLPEFVHKEDLAAASALNGIEFNIARATGPALAGALIAVAGVSAAFLVNVASFLGVILVVARWKRPVRARTSPPETLGGATVAAIRYVRNVPATRAVMLRSGVVMFCASAPFALLPSVAHSVSGSAIG